MIALQPADDELILRSARCGDRQDLPSIDDELAGITKLHRFTRGLLWLANLLGFSLMLCGIVVMVQLLP